MFTSKIEPNHMILHWRKAFNVRYCYCIVFATCKTHIALDNVENQKATVQEVCIAIVLFAA